MREYNELGYDLVKVHEGLAPDVFDAVAATAREVGLPFGGHVPDAVGLRGALAAGQVSIDHLDNTIEALVPDGQLPAEGRGLFGVGELIDRVDLTRLPQLVEDTRAAGAWAVPTMVLWETVFFGDRSAAELRAARPEVRYMPPETVGAVGARGGRARRRRRPRVEPAGRGIAAAGPAGSARGRRPHRAGDRFAADLQRARLLGASRDGPVGRGGDDPYAVLEAATRRVAEYFDALDDFGTIEIGRRADLLLLTANPIDDVANVARRGGVMVNGNWWSEERIQERLAGIAQFYGN